MRKTRRKNFSVFSTSCRLNVPSDPKHVCGTDFVEKNVSRPSHWPQNAVRSFNFSLQVSEITLKKKFVGEWKKAYLQPSPAVTL